jgi:hypothetical protein
LGVFVALIGRPARAADGPLLVVVEAPPALDADAAEIRRAIGAELRSQTIAPMKTSAASPGRALIVALDRERIAMSLRAGDATPVARSIPAPPEHAARLRAIAWLAGNLARDQVSPIVAEAPIEMPALATLPPAAMPPATAEPSQASVPYPATEPPPVADATNVISAHPRDERPSGSARWSVGVAYGPTSYFPVISMPNPGRPNLTVKDPFNSGFWAGLSGSAWRLDVQRCTGPAGLFVGAALEGTAGDNAPQVLGVMAFVGTAKHLGRWSFEPIIGAGLELASTEEFSTTSTESSSDGVTNSTTVGSAIRPALYADGAVAVAHPVSDSLDAIFRLGLHTTTAQFDDWFLSATLGLRYNL